MRISSELAGHVNRLAATLIVVASLLTACGQASTYAPISPTLRLAADDAAAPLAESLLNAYEIRHPNVLATLATTTREAALALVQTGDVDGALVLHPLDDKELFQTPIGRELIALIAHPDLDIINLHRREVRDIFSGQVVTWHALGGPATPIQVVAREAGSSARLAFDALVMQGQPLTPSARLAFNEAEMVALVGQTPGAIGYVAHHMLTSQVKSVSYEAAPPTLEAVQANIYPLVTWVEFIAREEPSGGSLRTFLDWILSKEGQDVVRRQMLGVND